MPHDRPSDETSSGRFTRDRAPEAPVDGAVATETTAPERVGPSPPTEPPATAETHVGTYAPPTTTAHETTTDRRSRQRAEFGGFHWGAAVFGWLVAFGLAALLTGIVAAAGAAIGFGELDGADTETIGLAGGILLVVVGMLAYYCGGYVAGRLVRFDGARQGLGVWLLGLLVTAGLALAAVIGGDEYNVIDRAGLPRFTVGEEEATTAGLIAMAAILVGTLLAATLGGKTGERYHRRIDQF